MGCVRADGGAEVERCEPEGVGDDARSPLVAGEISKDPPNITPSIGYPGGAVLESKWRSSRGNPGGGGGIAVFDGLAGGAVVLGASDGVEVDCELGF